MRFSLLPSSTAADSAYQFLSTILIDNRLAFDAGSLGFWGDLNAQMQIKDVVISHTHIDHLASLPIFLENQYGQGDPPTIHCTPAVQKCIKTDIFNGRLYPDLFAHPPKEGPFARFADLPLRTWYAIGNYKLYAIPVSHPVETVAVVIDNGKTSLAIVSDTGPTEEIWQFAVKQKNLSAVVLEVSFENELAWLADVSGHLTPGSFAKELEKVPKGLPVYATHLKPKSRARIHAQLGKLKLPWVQFLEPGKCYEI